MIGEIRRIFCFKKNIFVIFFDAIYTKGVLNKRCFVDFFLLLSDIYR